ncbi:LysR family transcriptional regulator [Gemmata sp. SH-PL17]|uniref:LysR family transcriptional regulator n=1 Tax=Gemmata sp. SH-PL17 TaxID=1630693 RepID=UPI0012FC5DF7|nr:LysR family transcriptional regulator [Gemmata sp. SH-PL17]
MRWRTTSTTAASSGPPPAGAVVAVDGGRIQTRVPHPGKGPGVHEHGWKEDKVACLYTLDGAEPGTDPPRVFTDRNRVDELARAIHAQRGTNPDWPALPAEAGSAPLPEAAPEADARPRVRPPARGERSCVVSMQDRDRFGKVVAAEAYARNFYGSGRRAFLGDGPRYNWAIRDKWFADFEPVADFVHVLSHLYAAATALSADAEERWWLYVGWMTSCWQSKGGEVVTAIRTRAEDRGWSPPGAEVSEGDWRVVVERTLTYVSNNAGHMEYPRYRRLGLPVTRAAVESLIKEINYRVKGTEKFWNESGAESVLQVRAAVLSEDERLAKHLDARPGSVVRRTSTQAA